MTPIARIHLKIRRQPTYHLQYVTQCEWHRGRHRTRDLTLGYYDADATDRPVRGLEAWLGPEEKRTARRHSARGREAEALI